MMTDFPDLLRSFILKVGADEWTATNPKFDKIRWPYRIHRDYLLHNMHMGRSMVWMTLRSSTPRQETDLMQTGKTLVEVFCFSRATSTNEADVENMVQQVHNVRDQLQSIVKRHAVDIYPYWRTQVGPGARELEGSEVTPPFLAIILPVEFWHDIDY